MLPRPGDWEICGTGGGFIRLPFGVAVELRSGVGVDEELLLLLWLLGFPLISPEYPLL